MASISANGSMGHHKFTLEVSQGTQSIPNNTTSVSYSFKLSPIQNSWNWSGWGSSISYSVTIDGTTYTGTIPNYDGYSTVTLTSGTQSVAHNADGTKSISYSFSVSDTASKTYTPGYASASGTLALSSIPRVSTHTVSPATVTMGDQVTINISRASTVFKHKLYYQFADSGWIEFASNVDTSYTWTVPIALANSIPYAMSGVVQIGCDTYYNGSFIGTEQASFTANVPNYTPTLRINSLTGNNLLEEEYVQGKSTVTADIAAGTSYGAGISSITSEVDGKTYTSAPFTTSVLSSGSKTVKVTVKDTRGKTHSMESAAFTVQPYAVPYITSISAERQSDGTTVVVSLKGGLSAVNNKNAKTFAVTLDGVTKELVTPGYSIEATTTFESVDTEKTFEVTAAITDSYTTVTRQTTLPTISVTMDFFNDGTGIALGKVAEKGNLFDVKWPVQFRGGVTLGENPLADYPIERGSSDGWTYTKWNSGDVECWTVFGITTAVTTGYGNGYYNGSTLSVNLPSGLLVTSQNPVININVQAHNAAIYGAAIAAFNQAESKISYYVTSFGSRASANVYIHIQVKGRWK